MSFMTLDVILLRKKNQNYYILLRFAFLSTGYLVLLMNGYILLCRCSKKAKSKNFWGPKYGLTVWTAFSVKFQLKFCLLLFFLAAEKKE